MSTQQSAVRPWRCPRGPTSVLRSRPLWRGSSSATARRRSGDDEGARLEWTAAHTALVRFGADRWAEYPRDLAAGAAVTAPQAATSTVVASESSVATFRCDGDTRTIGLGGLSVQIRDLLGFRYIARLVAEPGREFHVLDLVAVEHGSLPTSRPVAEHDELRTGRLDEPLPVLDDLAREAYRRRLAEVDDDIEEAERMNDLGRVELAQRDRDYLIGELSRAVGLSRRPRTTGGTSEHARTSVTRSLRYSLDKLADHHQPLAAHLRQRIHTGTYCTYAADPTSPVSWSL